MKAKIWVLCTVLADENAPEMPAVFADEAEAWAKYDEMIRAEWDNLMEAEDGPYPLVMAFARTQHHPVFAEGDRLLVLIGSDMSDGENRHCKPMIRSRQE
jgi:hypothetical protein